MRSLVRSCMRKVFGSKYIHRERGTRALFVGCVYLSISLLVVVVLL